jgi:protein TonB
MFDSVLQRRRGPKRYIGAGALLSAAIHASLLSFVIWASARTALDQEKDVAVTFFAPQAAPPPPPPPPPARSTKPKTQRIKPKTDAIVQPREDKPVEPQKDEEEDDETGGMDGGVAGGVEGGVVGGVEGGVVGGQLGSTTPVPAKPQNAVIPFGAGMVRPGRPAGNPTYTREAIAARVTGTVLVKCIITTEGALTQCKIIKGLAHMDQAVLAWLRRSSVTPVTFQGQRVSVEYVFNFRLEPP